MNQIYLRRSILVVFCLPLLTLLTMCNGRFYTAVPPTGQVSPEVMAQLHFVKQALVKGSATEMQSLFPEGYFFNYVLYGLAWVNVGLQSPPESAARQEALAEARWALTHLDEPAGTAVFSPTLDPPYGMFYAGWRNYLLAGILLLQPRSALDPREVAEFEIRSQEIATAVQRSSTPFVPSYPGQAWPVDSFPAILSLRAHTVLLDDRHEPVIQSWLAAARERLDPLTGLTPHRADARTGAPREGARGTSQTMILWFLADIDPAWGHEAYQTFRQQYVVTRWGLPGVLEFPAFQPGIGDVDSGPLLAGVSLSATAVFLGTSRVYGDAELTRAIWQGGEALGWAVQTGDTRRYALGLMPIGDAFVVWSKTAVPWLTEPSPPTYPPIVPWWWRWPLHLLSLGLIVVIGLAVRRLWR
ncbi:MAG: hypothetical protein KJ069_00985 [Anaerolineae bacterium]|nr:hypothetical protein [Anaerolineae bacterium]